ncbi:MAG TPA: Rrf2 family transcriptional regulator, partial [Blastocatellia bacterium]
LITAGQVVRAMDGRLAPIGCVSIYDYDPCEFEPACGLRVLWLRTRAAITGVLDQTTIADLCTPASYKRVVGLKSASK